MLSSAIIKLMVTTEQRSTKITVLDGDQTGKPLLHEALRALEATGVRLDFEVFDLSLLRRRETNNSVVYESADSMRETGLGIKAATITPEQKGDVGSPNAILRREIDGKVILRTGRRIPGVNPIGVNDPISIVRMAVGDAYDAIERRRKTKKDETAYRTESIKRSVCHQVAEFAFIHAEKVGGTVFGGPKYTVSPVYEGMLKEEMDDAALRHPDVVYKPQLIDATYALLIPESRDSGRELVIPALNRDGDCLSDLVLALYGSIAGAESTVVALDKDFKPYIVMTEAPHGTAPRLYRKNRKAIRANPTAMILAGAALLSYIPIQEAQTASTALRSSVLEAIRDGARTDDLGGDASMVEFTDEVISKTKKLLAVKT